MVLIERQESDPIYFQTLWIWSKVLCCASVFGNVVEPSFPCLIYHIYIQLSMAIVPMTIASDNEWQNVGNIFSLAVLGQWSPIPCTYAGGGRGR